MVVLQIVGYTLLCTWAGGAIFACIIHDGAREKFLRALSWLKKPGFVLLAVIVGPGLYLIHKQWIADFGDRR